MKSITLIFPHQLFEIQPALAFEREVWIIEEFLFFRKLQFHAHKLVLHRASMKAYEKALIKKGYSVVYIESKDSMSRTDLLQLFKKEKITNIHYVELVDTWLEKDMQNSACVCHVYNTPMFMTNVSEYTAFFAKKKKPFMKTFYEWQRKRLAILMEKDGTPVGGSYSFDTENRKKLPKEYKAPLFLDSEKNKYIDEAIYYVSTHFGRAYGDPSNFSYAITREGALRLLSHFVETRLNDFGVFEDAISSVEGQLNHSVLTPYLNIGLLTPHEVVAVVLDAYKQGKAPLNSVEGFVRQIIGWREFMRAMYMLHGSQMRTCNFWKHTKKLGKEWWSGTTGIIPIDTIIHRLLQTSYSHHIERLMILGNYMLLEEIHPDEVYIWFMEMYIDSYDWVMVPNVYGMSQFADGGIFATKPYISSSNYILKMSNYKKGDWVAVWDKKFWDFLTKHRLFFSKNPRMSMLLAMRDKNK